MQARNQSNIMCQRLYVLSVCFPVSDHYGHIRSYEAVSIFQSIEGHIINDNGTIYIIILKMVALLNRLFGHYFCKLLKLGPKASISISFVLSLSLIETSRGNPKQFMASELP